MSCCREARVAAVADALRRKGLKTQAAALLKVEATSASDTGQADAAPLPAPKSSQPARSQNS
jgi:hypothetical protein